MITMIIVLLGVLVTLYGVFTKNRVLYNVGYFVFGIVVVLDQFGLFSETNSAENLAMASLWMIQAIVAIPNKVKYDGSKLAKSAGVKINASLSVINGFAVYYATTVDYIPEFAMYIHGLLAVLPLIAIYLILSDKIEVTA